MRSAFLLLVNIALVLGSSTLNPQHVAFPTAAAAARQEEQQPRQQGPATRTSTGKGTARRWRRAPQHRPVDEEVIEVVDTDEKVHTTNYVSECNMPTDSGVYRMRAYDYTSNTAKLEPIVMISGDVSGKEDVLVRVHDQCFTSEVFGSRRCDCREQLNLSLDLIQQQGGVIIYLQQEGRGIGIVNKVAAYGLQDGGMDTVDANTHLGFLEELREYHAVPDILLDLDIRSIRLLTNNPYKIEQLRKEGVTISERVPIEIPSTPFNERYLKTKKDKMQHLLSEDLGPLRPLDEAATRQHTKKDFTIGVESKEFTTRGGATVPAQVGEGYAFGRASVEAAVAAVAAGKVVMVVDDADRENEGDFIMAAEKATAETIGFIVRYSSGVLCASLEGERLDALALPPMVVNNQDPKQTAYSVSVDHKDTSTGISAADRALTFRELVNPLAQVGDFQRPGHVFPLRYKPGGTLTRRGHTEASLDLSGMAGLRRGAVLAEVVHDDGSMMRLGAIEEFALAHGLVLTSVQDIAAYRSETEAEQL